MTSHRFPAMGCEVVVIGATPSEATRIEALFRHRDRVFSRFRTDSELSRVNRAPGELTRVSAEFEAMARCALRAATSTGGLVDPTLGEAVEAAGTTATSTRSRPLPIPLFRARPGGGGRCASATVGCAGRPACGST